MKEIQVKAVMIPIADYVTVKKENNLNEVLQALEEARKSKSDRAHRDAIVVDEAGNFTGKVTMIDIFRALEPSYRHVRAKLKGSTLSDSFVKNAVKQFNLWLEPERSICERGAGKKGADVMHTPQEVEYLQETDTLEKALNLYVMGVHQPLIVKRDAVVTGVLRFGDVFEVVRAQLLNCAWE
ncbi:MAG: CBS domain-containing protein [Desulfobacterales bacterium]